MKTGEADDSRVISLLNTQIISGPRLGGPRDFGGVVLAAAVMMKLEREMTVTQRKMFRKGRKRYNALTGEEEVVEEEEEEEGEKIEKVFEPKAAPQPQSEPRRAKRVKRKIKFTRL